MIFATGLAEREAEGKPSAAEEELIRLSTEKRKPAIELMHLGDITLDYQPCFPALTQSDRDFLAAYVTQRKAEIAAEKVSKVAAPATVH